MNFRILFNDLILLDIRNPKVFTIEPMSKCEEAYKEFEEWVAKNNMGSEELNEKHLMVYLNEKAKIQPSTQVPPLLNIFNMLRTALAERKNIDIEEYEYLKRLLEKKLRVVHNPDTEFLERNIDIFLEEADDDWALAMKVVAIIQEAGRLFKTELFELHAEDVTDEGYYFRIRSRNKRGKFRKEFIVTGELSLKIMRKYIDLRPETIACRYFFLAYNNGAYSSNSRRITKRMLGEIPNMIESFMKLPEPRTSLKTWYDTRNCGYRLPEDENI